MVGIQNMDVPKETIRKELEGMGYTGISDEMLDHFKQDLERVLREEMKSVGDTLTLSRMSGDDPLLRPDPIIINKERANLNHNGDQVCGTAQKQRIIKRKTIRHLNGKAYVSEESLVDTSSVSCLNDNLSSDRSLEEERSEHDSTDDCSSIIEQILPRNKENIGFKGPTSRLPILGYGTKPCDPVLRYHQYKKYWETHKPPGENSHKELRWFIREQMLDYDPMVEISIQNVPNIYKRRNPHRSNRPSSN